jgi:hypothetical protein
MKSLENTFGRQEQFYISIYNEDHSPIDHCDVIGRLRPDGLSIAKGCVFDREQCDTIKEE